MIEFLAKPEIQAVLLTALLGVIGWAFIEWRKKGQIVLEIELPNPEHIDLRLFRWILQVKIKNAHPAKTARNVKVWLKKIEWSPNQNVPLKLKQINFPILLPEAGRTDNTQAHEIAPKPFEKSFDLFFVARRF